MSFLIIGNDLDALILGRYLKDHGWPITFLSKQRFDYKSDCELVNPEQFKELGFDFQKGLLTRIISMEVIDLFGNVFETQTNTILVNMSTYKNDLFKSISKDCKIYENATFIDKNNENIFIQHGEHGTLIKSKYVVGIDDISLAKTVFESLTKKCIKATVERKSEKGKLTLKFLETGYIWVVNYSDRVAELCVVSENPEKDLSDFMFENELKIIYKRGFLIPFFKKDRILFNKNVYLSGASALTANNLNFYNLTLKLRFVQLTGKFCHELMTKKNVSYVFLTKNFDEELHKYEKQGKLFWSLSKEKKNEMIHKMSFKNFALDFGTAFDSLSIISPYKIKLLFG
ncbi:MAG: hypothetical protein COT14_03435 [Candidatus Diapherotrites archaeon CG08_land_8_20_14_0_20_30_16]|nr:MAG: hypothetical protein COT14_03435 [Candidatus Diapherotrites archaeon CG08_land_8_20_14_0_20_30_16]